MRHQAPHGEAQARDYEARALLRRLADASVLGIGAIPFRQLAEHALPNAPLGRVARALAALEETGEVRLEGRCYSITDAGRARLGIPPFHAVAVRRQDPAAPVLHLIP